MGGGPHQKKKEKTREPETFVAKVLVGGWDRGKRRKSWFVSPF
jgi:hypothetical protein